MNTNNFFSRINPFSSNPAAKATLLALLMLLASEVTGATDRLVQATDTVSIHRLQGRVEAYNDLLGAVKDAHKGLNRASGA